MTPEEKINVLKVELLKVQEKHIDWFKSRPPKFPEHGILHDELAYHYEFDNTVFGFPKGCELPEHIMNECIAVVEAKFKELESL